MALFGKIRNALSIPGDSLASPSGWMSRLLSLRETASGIVINEANALTVSDVSKCNRVIGETIAMLPWKIYRNDGDSRKEARRHPLYFLIHDEPNPHMTSFTFREYMSSCLVLRGRFFAYIERNSNGSPVALWPIRPDLCRFEVKDGVMWFFARTTQGVEVKFWDDEILYIPGLTRDGYSTYSPIELHRESLGLSKATELFGAKFFGNGSHAGGFLQHPKNLSKEAQARLKTSFEEKHKGVENASALAVLEEGMTFVSNTVPPEQAQFLQTRTFQRSDIAGIFRVPPHKIGDLSRSTNNNIEHQDLEFLRDCIAPWLERIEQACNRRLLTPAEKKLGYYIEFEIKGMMRGDTAARTAFYQAMFATGAYSSNMILRSENEEPVEGGDEHFVPMNVVPLSQAAKPYQDNAALDPTGDPLQRVRVVNQRFFRDAVGRVVNRKAADRMRYAETAFLQPILGLIECLFGCISEPLREFAEAQAAQTASASGLWLAENADAIAASELERCISKALLRGAK